VRLRGDQIVFSVADNGRGGAVLGGGSGLDGVQRRLATVDGTLEMDSPLGGPTTIPECCRSTPDPLRRTRNA
jgi:signal transduction histidine kinase